MVETVYDLCQPSMFTTTFSAKLGSSFFFPFGNLSLCSRKHESDQNPERTQPGLLSGKTSRVTAPIVPQGPEEMCLSLEHQKLSKTAEKWVILIALQFCYTFYRPQTKRLRARKIGLQPSVTLRATFRAPARIWLAVIDSQNGEQQSRSGQVRSEKIVYGRFIKIPLG